MSDRSGDKDALRNNVPLAGKIIDHRPLALPPVLTEVPTRLMF
ncbi:MAG: hypothetical protein PVI69_16110 [Desulfobacterales bacterium]